MSIRLLTTTDEFEAYDTWVQAHPEGNLWQSLAWKQYQEALGRDVRIYTLSDDTHNSKLIAHSFAITALVVIDRTFGGLSTWDIPRGPLRESSMDAMTFVAMISDAAKKQGSLSLTLSPPSPITNLAKFQPAARHVQPLATRIIDLLPPEETILAGMHQKGRYNIRVAKNANVTVREGSLHDIEDFFRLLCATSKRDGFSIAKKSHYERFLTHLEGSYLLIAEHEGTAIAGLLGVVWGKTGIYYYGASSYEHRALMAPYLLQWHAMTLCKAHGCTAYDLLGVSPEPSTHSDPWRGISDFKRKFGGSIVTYPPEQCCILRPIVYRLLQMKRGR